jgi:hypothetical protein
VVSLVSEIVIVKNYINDILKLKTTSIWRIYKNMLGTLGNPTFALNEPLWLPFTL